MKQSKVNVSVIVPVYCVQEELLRNCLTSLKEQDYEKAEFLIIDDGSTDESGRICDEYAALDKRFHVIHQENKGLSGARNNGIDHAQGEYILFVDGDDYVPSDLCAKSAAFMQEHDSDFAVLACRNTSGRGGNAAGSGKAVKLTEEAVRELAKSAISHIDIYDGYLSGPCWGKIFKKEILEKNNIRCVDGVKKSQDRVFMFDYYSCCSSGYLYDYVGYYYVDDNPFSVTNRYNPKIVEILDNTRSVFRGRVSLNGQVLPEYEFVYKSLCLRLLIVILRLYVGNKNCPLSMNERRAELIRVLSINDYKEALSVMEKAALGKRRVIVLMFIKLGMYKTALRLSETLLDRK